MGITMIGDGIIGDKSLITSFQTTYLLLGHR
jgi:hypothetical protein